MPPKQTVETPQPTQSPQPANGGPGDHPFDDFQHESSHTISADEVARRRGLMHSGNAGQELFAGRPTIGRDTFPINGHVDIRSWQAGGEAIVVDSDTEPEQYNELRTAFDTKLDELRKEPETKLGRLKKRFSKSDSQERVVLQAIHETVKETMEYDLDYVSRFSDSLQGQARKVNLSLYLQEGKGVCRHMALASVWLAGDALDRGLLPAESTTTSEVNQNMLTNGAHEWARYTSPKGEVFVLDQAQQDEVMTLDEVAQGVFRGRNLWEYFRNAEEKKKYLAKFAGKFAIKETMSQEDQLRVYGFRYDQPVIIKRGKDGVSGTPFMSGARVEKVEMSEDGTPYIMVMWDEQVPVTGKFNVHRKKFTPHQLQVLQDDHASGKINKVYGVLQRPRNEWV